MDRQQLIDLITAIDLQIGDIREYTKSLDRRIAMCHEEPASDRDRQQCARCNHQLRSLVGQKRALRSRIAGCLMPRRSYRQRTRAARPERKPCQRARTSRPSSMQRVHLAYAF